MKIIVILLIVALVFSWGLIAAMYKIDFPRGYKNAIIQGRNDAGLEIFDMISPVVHGIYSDDMTILNSYSAKDRTLLLVEQNGKKIIVWER